MSSAVAKAKLGRMLIAILAVAAVNAAAQAKPLPDPARDLSKRECIERGGFWGRGCSGPLKGKLLPLTNEIKAETTSALAQQFGAGTEIVDATRELREGGEVVCGFYATPRDRADKIGRPFSWSGGKLIMEWGPNWNLGTLCLIANCKAPLP